MEVAASAGTGDKGESDAFWEQVLIFIATAIISRRTQGPSVWRSLEEPDHNREGDVGPTV